MRRLLLLRSTLPRRSGAESNRKQTTSPILLPRLSRHGSHSPGLILFSSSKSNPTPNLLNLSNQQYNYFAHEYFSSQSNAGKENQLNDHLQVEIISKENIKPASPTPDHLRTYEVSILDQLFPNMYVPFVYFYENNHDQLKDDHDLIISERRKVLKRSLSKILTRFYPLAGKVKDSRHIDCNDEGVYYVEAKVNTDLSDFINCNNQYSLNMNRLLPFDHNSNELFSQTYLVMIQVTVFGCGGIAIGLYTSHKIMDGSSHATFLKAWAAAAHGESSNLSIVKIINPSFISPSIFPSNPALPQGATLLLLSSSSSLKVRSKSVIRRFVFSGSSLKTLKKKTESSSRAMAVTGLIWKCVMSSNKARSSTRICSSLSIAVNLRNKISPPVSPYAIGNIIWYATSNYYEKRQQLIKVDDDYDSIATILKNTVQEINSDFVEKMKGKVLDQLNEMKKELYSNENVDFMTVSSMCNCEIYEATDFGWGKPIWASVGYGCVDFHLHNFLLLMDTRFGNGVEAWLTLSEEDMDLVEKDQELLAFASLNPCPLLQTIHDHDHD